MATNTISVRSHVARDLLQSAALFKTEKLVVWEYVSNGLQYRDTSVPPVVTVTLDTRGREIVITDNGRGMDREGLQNFFVMHGENLDRIDGRKGRGRFGTGKAAAFGIADVLEVSSIKDGKHNTVSLSRKEIEAAGAGNIRVRNIDQDKHTSEPNGTTVKISDIKLSKLDQAGIVSYIERHMAHWPGKPTVLVNNHLCEYNEPAIANSRTVHPAQDLRKVIGDVELSIKVAKSPLSQELQGVAIYSNGNWLETTLAGAEGQAMAQYIFGHIDVPALDDDSAPIPAFDMSRSMKLNVSNEVAQAVMQFVGYEVDRIRRELVQEEKSRKAQEDAKKLDREARKIADMINGDFREFSDRFARVKAKRGRGRDAGGSFIPAGPEDTDLLLGGEIPATETTIENEVASSNGKNNESGEDPNPGPVLSADENGQPKGKALGGEGSSKRSRGGFSVEFKDMGENMPRASYVSSERTIYINTDHPQIRAAKGSNDSDDPVFRRLAYEVAFSEYAFALGIEMDNNGEFIEPSDAIVEIRETVNRMAKRAARLYAE